MNAMGEFIWEHLSEWVTMEDAVNCVINDLIGKFDHEEVAGSIEEYIQKLIKIGYMEVEEN